MKARRFLITVAMAAAVAVPGALLAQGGFGGPPPDLGLHGGFGGPGLDRFEEMLPRLAEFLALTDAQQSQIQAILDEEMPAIDSLRDQLRAAHEAFRSAHQPGQFDEAAVRAFGESQCQNHVDLMVASARAMSRIHNVLTPEQQQKLQDARGLFGRHGGPGRDRGANVH
jgi:Spy/CpxP family protein refolding chaperone